MCSVISTLKEFDDFLLHSEKVVVLLIRPNFMKFPPRESEDEILQFLANHDGKITYVIFDNESDIERIEIERMGEKYGFSSLCYFMPVLVLKDKRFKACPLSVGYLNERLNAYLKD